MKYFSYFKDKILKIYDVKLLEENYALIIAEQNIYVMDIRQDPVVILQQYNVENPIMIDFIVKK